MASSPCSVHALRLAEATLDDRGPGATLFKLQCFTQMPGLLEGYQSIEPNTEVVAQTPLEGNGEGLFQNLLLQRQKKQLEGEAWPHEQGWLLGMED